MERLEATDLVACVDFGSTYTKAALVDTATGSLVATAEHRTTIESDVLDGWDACLSGLVAADPRAADAEALACSSAGGGLRIGVVGNEELVTAEAGRRVALSSGGKVVHVAAGVLDDDSLGALQGAEPDVVLLVGGTDGGNAEVLLACAARLALARWRLPVVVAGNVDAQPEIAAGFDASGTPYVLADNVVPRIGVLEPGSARAAIRDMFVRHVIGGKQLSSRVTEAGTSFASMVRGATPDVVLTAVELLARGLDAARRGVGDVVVVDVGGATTDVHSVVELDPEEAALTREVVATTPVSRTVEGDLGMRWSAPSTVEAGVAAGVVSAQDADLLRSAAAVHRACPARLAEDAADRAVEEQVAATAVTLALRRHAGRSQVVYDGNGCEVLRSGTDLREVGMLVGSGGVLRHGDHRAVHRILSTATGAAPAGGWQLPRTPRVVVDHDYVLAAAGLLAAEHREAAYRLLGRLRDGHG
ncbi:MAG TPA: glutamate mutase L [Nocardioidaceae bacterium]|nr:glutamate mutase L [Nocardioidaceae bacterium]